MIRPQEKEGGAANDKDVYYPRDANPAIRMILNANPAIRMVNEQEPAHRCVSNLNRESVTITTFVFTGILLNAPTIEKKGLQQMQESERPEKAIQGDDKKEDKERIRSHFGSSVCSPFFFDDA